MKCSACQKEATKVQTAILEIMPGEIQGNISYKKYSGERYFFCDKHSLHIETVAIGPVKPEEMSISINIKGANFDNVEIGNLIEALKNIKM